MDRRVVIAIIILIFAFFCGSVSAASVSDLSTKVSSEKNFKETVDDSLDDNIKISGTVYHCGTSKPFAGVKITIKDLADEITAQKSTDQNGFYNAQFKSSNNIFKVTASYPGHHPVSNYVKVTPINSQLTGTVNLELGTIIWIDNTTNPIYNPGSRACYPSVVYDANSFGVSGGPHYKMWYDNGSTTLLTTSNDGLNWSIATPMGGLYTTSGHVKVVYDSNGFGSPSGPNYKMIYWDGGMSYTLNNMRYAESSDGINWTQDQVLTQDPANQLVVNDPSHASWNSGTYGPCQIFYQSGKTNTGSNPWNYSYVMYYDGTTGGKESMGLAYSVDCKYWIAYSNLPVIDHGVSGEWDSDFATFGTIYREPGANGLYHLYYSGGQSSTNEGIGQASSVDGLTWSKDPVPLYHVSPSAPSYRVGRVYTPYILYDGSGNLKMYYSGSPTSSGSGLRICLANSTLRSDWYVDEATGIDAEGRGGITDPFKTIGYAVSQSYNGNTIHVAAGTYQLTSVLNINKSLTILGPQANIDPRPLDLNPSINDNPTTPSSQRTGPEAIIDGGFNLSSLIQISADNVTINGFEIKNGTGDLINGPSLTGSTGTLIQYCLIHDSAGDEGIQLRSCVNGVVEYNYIFNTVGDMVCISADSGYPPSNNCIIRNNYGFNNEISPDNGTIYLYNAQSTLVEGNVLNFGHGHGIKIGSNNDAPGTILRNNIFSNVVGTGARYGVYIKSNNTSLFQNSIYNIKNTGTSTDNYAIEIVNNVTNTTIKSNNIHDNPRGIDIYSIGANNHINFNNIYHNTLFGLRNNANTAIDAENNFWGVNDGPTGLGDKITGTYASLVDYNPWLVLKITATPQTIYNTHTANITADLTWNSDNIQPNGGHMADGVISLFNTSIGHINSPVTTLNGKAVSTLYADTITGTANVSTTVDAQTVSLNLDIIRIPTSITVSPANGETGDNISLSATLNDHFNTAINGKSILFKVDGDVVGSTFTNAMGIAIIPYTISKGDGNYTILAEFSEDPVYEGSSGTNILHVHNPLQVTSIDPANGSTNVPPTKIITITFSKTINPGSAYNNIMVLRNSTGTNYPITKSIVGNILYIAATTMWSPQELFTINIPVNAVEDNTGTGLSTAFSSTFTSASPPIRDTRTDLRYYKIQDAIDDPLTHDGDTIEVSPGTYLENVFITKSLQIMGLNRDTTIIDGNLSNSVIRVSSGVAASLINFTLINGYAANGGGINNNGNLTVINCIITGNDASNGGAVFNYGELKLKNSSLTNNHAPSGGAIYNAGLLTLETSTINNNVASMGGAIFNTGYQSTQDSIISTNIADYGAAIFNASGKTIVNSTQITGNTAIKGGAIFNISEISILNSLLSSNTAGKDGGVINNVVGVLQIDNCNLTLNQAANYGGVLNNEGYSLLTNSYLAGNQALYGGAIFNTSGTVVVDNITLRNNLASMGAAIFNCADLTITNSAVDAHNTSKGSIYNIGTIAANNVSFTSNTASEGAGIYNTGFINIKNSTFAGNSANYGAGLMNSEGTATMENCLLTGNLAIDGGAIFNSANLNLTNCNLNSNTANKKGAAIRNTNILVVGNTNINNNVSEEGAIYNTGFTHIMNSNINGNTAVNGAGICNFGGITELNNCLMTGNAVSAYGGAICNAASLIVRYSVIKENNAAIITGVFNCGPGTLINDHSIIIQDG